MSYSQDKVCPSYSGVDHRHVKRGEAEYQRFLGELRKADAEAFGDGAAK